ncbi:MAG: 4-alpha-glucanotransferase [bacterium]|nr:4-alpha-glucanotransferase [bacterium]
MKIKRSSGLLMHISSLPGKYGVGTMGKEAMDFIDLLADGGQKYWQILPVGPVCSTFGYSPYSSFSSFAGNYLFINLEILQKENWMRNYILSEYPQEENNDFIDFDSITARKLPLLVKFSEKFFKYANEETKADYELFCTESAEWLDDYALFVSLAEHYNSFNWLTWEKDIRRRTPEAMSMWKEKLSGKIDYHKFIQYVFFKQWNGLKKYAARRGVQIIGDIPIYVTFDSAETWANPGVFHLDPETERPLEVAGVPPDYFSKTGQRWGNPLYCWFKEDKLNEDTLDWWAIRFKHALELFDVIRVDHFRGFESFWAVPAEEETAVKGEWKKGPGLKFFKKIKEKLGSKSKPLPLIAEDLGIITPEVEKLRDDLKLPGMKILQFAFTFENKNSYLPHNYKSTNCIVYTGTHDNNTTNGWFYENEIDEETREYVLKYLGIDSRDEFHWQLIRLALTSIADLAVTPVQDILGYAGEFRMNVPGKVLPSNWAWKLTPGRLTPELMKRLKELCRLYNRLP